MPIKLSQQIDSMTLKGGLGIWFSVCTAAALMGSLFFVRLNADVNWDGVVFITAAKKFATGGFSEGFSAWAKFPAYPYLIFMTQNVIPDWVSAGRFISLAATISVVAGVYRLTDNMFGPKPAILSALVFSFLPETLLQSNAIYRDPVFLAALIWSIYFFQKSIRSGNTGVLALALFLLLISCMFRAEGLIILLVYACTLLLHAYRVPTTRKRNLLFLSVCMGAPLLLAILFLTVSNFESTYTGQILKTFRGYNNSKLWENYSRISEHLQNINDTTPNSDVGVHFGIMAERMIPIIFALGTLIVLAQTLLLTNTAFFLIGIRKSNWTISNQFVLASAIAYFGILYAYFISYDLMLKRWMLPIAAMICPWVGVGILYLLHSIKRVRYSIFFSTAFLVILALNSAIEFNKFFNNDDNLAGVAGAWIAKQGHCNGKNTIFNDPVVAFYAGIDLSFTGHEDTPLYLNTDDKTFSSIESFTKERISDFIVLYVKKNRVNTIAQFSDFVKIREFESGRRVVIIYCSRVLYPQLTSQPDKSI